MSLMGFMLMLILVLSTLTQLEMATASTREQKDLARENARLGLLIALGQLQQTAGPDQRVTARAEILGDGNFYPGNRYWTGVWNTKSMAAGPEWLISGSPGVNEPVSGQRVQLAGQAYFGEQTDLYIYAPKVGTTSPQSGNYAYWVADEGVKVSLGKNSNLDQYASNPSKLGLTALELKRLRQISGDRPRFEKLFSEIKKQADEQGNTSDIWEATIGDSVACLVSVNQLDLLPSLTVQDASETTAVTEMQHHRTDVTYLSKGVLANTDAGGLKKDLSNDALVDGDSPFPLNTEFWSFLKQRVNSDDHATTHGLEATFNGNGAEVAYSVGEPINPVGPVLTEFALYVGVFKNTMGTNSSPIKDPQLRLDIAVRADIWNPYAVNLKATPKGQLDYYIQILGLPDVEIDWVTSSTSPSKKRTGTIDLDLYSYTLDNKRSTPNFKLDNVPLDIDDKMAVGEVCTISERGEAVLRKRARDEIGNSTVSDDFIAFSAPATELTIVIKTADGKLIQQFTAIPYDPLDTEAEKTYNFRVLSSPNYPDYQFAYHWKFLDEIPPPYADLEKWMSIISPRSPFFSVGGDDAAMFFVNKSPAFAAFDQEKFLGRPEFFYGGNGASLSRNYHSFFDFPTTEPISVGLLQHMDFHFGRPFSIGNPWGDNKNEVFDRYYFSSLNDGRKYGDPLPNHHLSTFECGVDAEDPVVNAAAFMVDGAFNLNSTSVDAWRAAIASVHLYDWDYRIFEEDTYGGGTLNRDHVKNGVFRFSHSADRTFTHPSSTTSRRISNYPEGSQSQREGWYSQYWLPDWAAAFTVGMRELRDGENRDNIDDVTDLAEKIVEKLKDRGAPFKSIEELLNSGMLQEAIDDTMINTVGSKAYSGETKFLKKFPRYAPSFVTQADLINILAPYAQVRSDTFMIRAYGDAIDPLTGEVTSSAMCEAVVQRIPTPMDVGNFPSTAEYQLPSSNMGRQFIILDFRWLDDSEI